MSNGKSAGFTLIELVIVIVILGVLAAVAAPRFIDLSQEAEASALRAQASGLSSASAINFAAYRAGSDDATDIENCDDVPTLMDGWDDDAYTVTSEAIDDGETQECTLTQESTGNDDQFIGYGVQQ